MNKVMVLIALCWIPVFSSIGGSIGQTERLTEEWVDFSPSWRVRVIRQKDYKRDKYLSVGSQRFYVYSNIEGDFNYKGSELDVEFIDLNGDGWLDVLITGIVNYTGEVDYEIYEQESVAFIYLCDAEEKKFRLMYKKASFDIEVKDDAAIKWHERYISTDPFYLLKYKEFRELDEKKKAGGNSLIEPQHAWHYTGSGMTKCDTREGLKEIMNYDSESGTIEQAPEYQSYDDMMMQRKKRSEMRNAERVRPPNSSLSD